MRSCHAPRGRASAPHSRPEHGTRLDCNRGMTRRRDRGSDGADDRAARPAPAAAGLCRRASSRWPTAATPTTSSGSSRGSRAILPLDGFHCSRSLRRTLRSGRFTVTRDHAFAEVVAACADREETWINADDRASDARAPRRRPRPFDRSAGTDGELVGGLYGVKLGRAFFGESMFSRATDASKVALAWLVARLKVGDFTLLDCQFMTDHLRLARRGRGQPRGLCRVAWRRRSARRLGAARRRAARRRRRGRRAARSPAPPADFGALDRLLEADRRGRRRRARPEVIAQLLGQTS